MSVVKAARARIKGSAAIMAKVKAVEANIIRDSSQFPAIYIAQAEMIKNHCYGGYMLRGNIEIGVYADTYAVAEEVIGLLRTLFDRHRETFEGMNITYNTGEEEADSYDDEVKKEVKVITFPVVATK